MLNKVPSPRVDLTAAERSPLQLAGPPLGGLLLGAALAASFLIHSALLGTMLMAEPRPNPTEQVESIAVELVPETEPEKPAPAEEPKPEVKPDPKPEPAQKPPPRLVIPDFNQMMAAQQALEPPGKQATAKPQSPTPFPAPNKNQAQPSGSPSSGQPSPAGSPQQTEKPDAEKSPVIETSPQDAQAAAARLADTMHLPESASLGAAGGKPSETKAKLTAEEVAAFRAEIRRCWSAPTGVPAGQNPRVYIRVAFKPDGSFTAEPETLGGSPSAFAVLSSAKQALKQCQPYRSLPTGKYAEWKLLDLQFTARDIAVGVSPPKQ